VWRNESWYWMGSQLIINFWVLYDTLRRHLHLIGLTSNLLCRRCGAENETSAHILCECEALASIRHPYLDSFFLEPEDMKSLGLGAIWNFGKGTGHTWGDRGGTVVKVLCYKSEGRWFDPSCCHWNFSLTWNPFDCTMALGLTQPLTEMSTRSIYWG